MVMFGFRIKLVRRAGAHLDIPFVARAGISSDEYQGLEVACIPCSVCLRPFVGLVPFHKFRDTDADGRGRLISTLLVNLSDVGIRRGYVAGL